MDTIDKKVSDFLDDVLRTAPNGSLSSDFSKKIQHKIYHTFQWKSYLGMFFSIIGITLLVCSSLLLFFYFVYPNTYTVFAQFSSRYRFIISILGALSAILVFYNYVLLNFLLFYYKKRILSRKQKLPFQKI